MLLLLVLMSIVIVRVLLLVLMILVILLIAVVLLMNVRLDVHKWIILEKLINVTKCIEHSINSSKEVINLVRLKTNHTDMIARLILQHPFFFFFLPIFYLNNH